MSVASRIQEIETHIGDIYDTLEVGGTDLTDLNKNIVNINSSLKDRYKYFLNNGVEVIWNNWEKVIGEGAEFTLENTIQAPMKINLKGNTSQEGTPTPDSPQEIHTVSGDNTIEVVGKNLYDISNSLDGKYYESTGALTNATNAFGEMIELDTDTISFSIQNNYTDSLRSYIFLFDKDMNRIGAPRWGDALASGGTYSLQNYQREGAKYITVSILGVPPASKNQVKIMLNRGATINDYQPYQKESYPINLGDIELCKIGNYQDYLYKDNGKWYLYKEIGKVVLDGTEDGWSKNSEVSSTNAYINPTVFVNRLSRGIAYSDYLKRITSIAAKTGIYSAIHINLCFESEDFDTLEKFKTWLQAHNMTVYYQLATPTYTEITDTTLLSQLEAVYKAISHDDQTNISQVNNDMPFKLEVTALKNI